MTIHIGTIHIGPIEMYAIGGSANLTINSQGNRFLAPGGSLNKDVLQF